MTVPQWFLLLAAICIGVRSLIGVIQVIDACKVGAGGRPVSRGEFGSDGNACADTFPCEWVGPYDQERHIA